MPLNDAHALLLHIELKALPERAFHLTRIVP